MLPYCLLKIQKRSKSIRPIVSGNNSTTYLISQWLAEENKNITVKQKSLWIKNTLEFVKAINKSTRGQQNSSIL